MNRRIANKQAKSKMGEMEEIGESVPDVLKKPMGNGKLAGKSEPEPEETFNIKESERATVKNLPPTDVPSVPDVPKNHSESAGKPKEVRKTVKIKESSEEKMQNVVPAQVLKEQGGKQNPNRILKQSQR